MQISKERTGSWVVLRTTYACAYASRISSGVQSTLRTTDAWAPEQLSATMYLSSCSSGRAASRSPMPSCQQHFPS